MQADVDPRRHALALDLMLTEQARVLSGQEPSLKRAYCSWVKPGSVRNADRIWVSTPQNRTYRAWRTAKLTPIGCFVTAL